MENVWTEADIVISSMGGSEPIIKKELIEKITPKREGRPLFIIDLGVPRNVEESIKAMDDVYLYDMDHLQRHADDNIKHREKLLASCQPYIDEGVEEFSLWVSSLAHQEVITDVMKRNGQLIENELQKSMKKLGDLDEAQLDEVRYLVQRVCEKSHASPHPQLCATVSSNAPAPSPVGVNSFWRLSIDNAFMHFEP